MFEDGIGIVRSYVDEFEDLRKRPGCPRRRGARRPGLTARYIVGEAMQPFLDAMIAASPLPAVSSPSQ